MAAIATIDLRGGVDLMKQTPLESLPQSSSRTTRYTFIRVDLKREPDVPMADDGLIQVMDCCLVSVTEL